jgi:glucose uptake protein GlcU
MDTTLWLILTFSAVLDLVIIGILLYTCVKQKERKTDYRTFFIFGISFLPLGIMYMVIEDLFTIGVAFLGLGLVYLAIGLGNKDKWEKKEILAT